MSEKVSKAHLGTCAGVNSPHGNNGYCTDWKPLASSLEERRAARDLVEFRTPLSWDGGDGQSRDYQATAVNLQMELTEAVGLLREMYHEMGHLMITHEWQQKRRAFLERNK